MRQSQEFDDTHPLGAVRVLTTKSGSWLIEKVEDHFRELHLIASSLLPEYSPAEDHVIENTQLCVGKTH